MDQLNRVLKEIRVLWLGLILPGFVSPSFAQNHLLEVLTDPTVQLVQSVPEETDLAQPGVSTTVDAWVKMIQGARFTLDMAQFYLSAQPQSTSGKGPVEKKPLEPVIAELEKAAKRGVRIRLLLSPSLLNEDPLTLERFKKMRGVSIRVFDMSKLTGGVHHAKYWIVDQKEIFVGSQNFDWRSMNQIHELGVRVQDSDIARKLTRIFDLDWKVAKSHELPEEDELTDHFQVPQKSSVMELVASPSQLRPSDTRPAIEVLLELIQSAKKIIRVQLMDYSPAAGNQVYWPEIDNALRAAALRGVKIEILVSNGSSSARALDFLKSLALIPGVEVKMVTIPLHSSGSIPYARLIRSKYMVVDDEVFWIGTSNWSKGYFYNSRNIELVFRRSDLAQLGNQIFKRIWSYPYSENIIQVTELNSLKKMKEN